MARSGAGKVSARERARAAKAKLDAEQRDHEKLVEDAVTAYYDAEDKRAAAAAALAAADTARAAAVKTLTDLNEPPKRIAALVGLSPVEIRKLRRTTTTTTTTAGNATGTGRGRAKNADGSAAASTGGTRTDPVPDTPEAEPEAALAS